MTRQPAVAACETGLFPRWGVAWPLQRDAEGRGPPPDTDALASLPAMPRIGDYHHQRRPQTATVQPSTTGDF